MFAEILNVLREQHAIAITKVLDPLSPADQRSFYAGAVAAIDAISAILQTNVNLDPASFEPQVHSAQIEPEREDFISASEFPV